ncbi:MAG: hypothetical protein EZS28_018729 [Streblomastix strix]|uniref:Uncharacterized protein n=1 Tax=Streblomastix strix TaxID=222440 RepID=A0A5J4VSZ7_9EUKA|nr:MAG: hypothetical protein EZS28_018729 [Streblomastix strix]
MQTTKKGKKAKKSQKAIATRPILPLIRKSIKEKENQQQDPESDYEYAKHIQEKKFRQVNYQRLRTEQLAKIPELMRQKGLKLKKGITQAEQYVIENEIRRMDTSITAAEAHGGVFAISNPAARRRIYTEGFHKCLLQELYETNIRINNEEYTLAQEKLFEAQRQQIEADIISSVNLNTVHDIGALDWVKPPINDVYGRKPFETYASGYKYDQFGNSIAFMMKPTQPIAQADLHKNLTKSAKIAKKK